MDPQQRGLLQETYLALENSEISFHYVSFTTDSRKGGIPLHQITGSKTSVFTGCFMDDYRLLYAKDPENYAQYGATGLAASILANRLSWFFNLRGTSVNIDTACSSSLVALDLACQSLLSKDCNMVGSKRSFVLPKLFLYCYRFPYGSISVPICL